MVRVTKSVYLEEINLQIEAAKQIKEEIKKFDEKTLGTNIFSEISKKYKNQIKNWLDKKKIIDNHFFIFYNNFLKQENLEKLKISDYDKAFRNYRDNTLRTSGEEIKKELKILLKDGYLIVHSIRDMLLEKTQYRVLYESKEQGEVVLHEQTIDLERVLKNLNLSIEHAEINLKKQEQIIGKTFSDLYKLTLSTIKPTKEEKENSKISSVFYNYLLEKENKNQLLNTETNKGYIYEGFVFLTELKNFSKDKVPKRQLKIIRAALDFSKKNHTPGWQGGDVNNLQVKNLISGASVITSLSLDKVMNELFIALDSAETKGLEKLKQIYIEDLDKNKIKIEENINKYASGTIKRNLLDMLKDI